MNVQIKNNNFKNIIDRKASYKNKLYLKKDYLYFIKEKYFAQILYIKILSDKSRFLPFSLIIYF